MYAHLLFSFECALWERGTQEKKKKEKKNEVRHSYTSKKKENVDKIILNLSLLSYLQKKKGQDDTIFVTLKNKEKK